MKVYNFYYTGAEQSITLPPGKYKIECWGANGGSNTSMSPDKYKNACGGYTVGTFLFNENKTVYIYVGKEGTVESVDFNNPSRRGFNGAGLSYEYTSSVLDVAFDGGGATDVRIVGGAWDNPQGLLSRFIVAGGGGGWTNDKYTGGTGKGGGLTSNDLEFCTGASQVAGGVVNKDYPAYMNGSFGKGGGKIGFAVGSNRVKYGGGGGWFGGACGLTTSGSGGSGYLLSVNSYKPSGYLVDSSFYALDGSTNSLTPETYNSPIFPSCHGFCRITLLQGFISINVNSYTSTQAKFTVSHTEEGALKKIEWYLDGVLKETFTANLTSEKIINYILTDNAIHTLKIVATDAENATAEKVLSISKEIMPLQEDANLSDISTKLIEIGEGFKNGKTSIINTLALKNIEASLNNTLVELSEKIKTSFDSSDASVQALKNRITELTNQLSQRKRWAKGTSIVNSNRLILNLPFDPNICILNVRLEENDGKYFGYGYLNSECPNHQVSYILNDGSASTLGYVNLTRTGTNFTMGGEHKVVSCDWFVAE